MMITDSGVYLSNSLRRTRPYELLPLCSALLGSAQWCASATPQHTIYAPQPLRRPGRNPNHRGYAASALSAVLCGKPIRLWCTTLLCRAAAADPKSQPRRIYTSISTADNVPTSYRRHSSLRTVMLRGSPHCGRQPSVSRPVRAISRRDSQFSSAPRVVAAYSASTPARAPVAIHPEQRA